MPNSTPVFLDTAYVYALINSRDQWHDQARHWEEALTKQRRPLVTTEFILIEIADGLAAIRFREHAIKAIEMLTTSSLVSVVPVSSELYEAGLKLYRERLDKEWGLTDCMSFVVMDQKGLQEALTTDDHFRQAGFRALLLDESPKS